jgi:hypothetical protein
MFTSTLLFLAGLLFATGPATPHGQVPEALALRDTAPGLLTVEQAAHHVLAADVAGAVFDVDPQLLLAIAWHESRYVSSLVTSEPGRRVSCGVMTPVPHASPCSRWETSTFGGYWEGARHLRTWMDVCRANGAGAGHATDRAAGRCPLLAYAGGRGLYRICATAGHFVVRPGVDACDLPDLLRARVRALREAVAVRRRSIG